MSPFKSGLVVSANALASRAGARVLKKGGNAVDAALTTAHMLGVAAPAFSGIGGGGFALIWLAREEKTIFVDFRERAPLAAREEMFNLTPTGKVLREENAIGYKSVAVPGTISGHASVLEKYGTMHLADTLEPATRTARRGCRVGRAQAYAWQQSAKKLARFKESGSTYLKRGRPYREGDMFTLPKLAKSLTAVAHEGAEEFYRGPLGRKITDDMTLKGGLMTGRDFEDYEPTVREPLHGSYRDYEIVTAPPPSCGGAMILESLNMLEELPPGGYRTSPSERLHLLAEVLARASMSCRPTISDPDFANAPVEKLLSKSFAKELAASVSPNTSSITSLAEHFPSMPASNTTHLVAVDDERNVVSLTESVECYFGSGVTVPETGIILNDTMHDFEPRRDMPNSVAPGKIPMSSMSPTIVFKEGVPILVLGSAGGPRIVSSTLQVLLNVIEFGLNLEDAVAAPRIHVNGSRVELEENVGHNVARRLKGMGHSIKVKKQAGPRDPGLYFGGVQAAQLSDDKWLGGAADPRRDGLAAGL